MWTNIGRAPISDLLRRTIARAVEGGKTNYLALERETGVARASIMRFVRGTQSLHLGVADRLAAHFGLELRKKRQKEGEKWLASQGARMVTVPFSLWAGTASAEASGSARSPTDRR